MQPNVAATAIRYCKTALSAAVIAAAPLLVAATVSTAAHAASNQPAMHLIKVIPINGTAGNPKNGMYAFDISWVDPVNGLYYLADRSNAALDVIDTTGAFTGHADTLFGQIGGSAIGFAGFTGSNDTSGPDGVVTYSNCIFAGDGTSRLISINSNVSFTTLASSVNTGGKFRVDELAYDPTDGLVVGANNADDPPFATIFKVDKTTCQLSSPVKVTFTNMPLASGGTGNATNGVEQPVWDPTTGRFYVSIPEINGPGDGTGTTGGIARITTGGTIETVYPINFCQPSGLTVGPNGDLLAQCSKVFDLAGKACSSNVPNGKVATCSAPAFPQVAVCNPSRGCTGNALVSIPGVGGGDEVYYNAGDGNYYTANQNDPVGSVLGVVGSAIAAQPNQLVQLVPTLQPVAAVTGVHPSGSVHSVAASSFNNEVYVPIPATNNIPHCTQGCIAVYSSTAASTPVPNQ